MAQYNFYMSDTDTAGWSVCSNWHHSSLLLQHAAGCCCWGDVYGMSCLRLTNLSWEFGLRLRIRQLVFFQCLILKCWPTSCKYWSWIMSLFLQFQLFQCQKWPDMNPNIFTKVGNKVKDFTSDPIKNIRLKFNSIQTTNKQLKKWVISQGTF